MIEGPSGLRGAASGFAPQAARPAYAPSRRRLLFANGAVAHVFSAEDPDSLRGPQFAAAWADEVCAWRAGDQVLAMARMGLRLGERPRLVLTTTPRPTPVLRTLLGESGLVLTRGSAQDNAAHLAPGFVEGLSALYGGTRLARQEIDGEVLEAEEGAIFRSQDLARARELGSGERPARFDRLAVAVDPPAGRGKAACGIVVAGRLGDQGWVLEDATCHGLAPADWAARAVEAARRWCEHGPLLILAEANQGGDMVGATLSQAGAPSPVQMVHALIGKRARAEPVSLLYEQGRIAHAPGLTRLEEQLLLLGQPDAPLHGGRSPDRADALVWALASLFLRERAEPRVRRV